MNKYILMFALAIGFAGGAFFMEIRHAKKSAEQAAGLEELRAELAERNDQQQKLIESLIEHERIELELLKKQDE